MNELQTKHRELCNKLDKAIIDHDELHRKAKYLKQVVIVELENELKKLEKEMYPKKV